MSQNPLAQPPSKTDGRFDSWIFLLWKRVGQAGQILWAQLNLTGAEFTGDSGSGGTAGIVPAPVSGDASKYLKGDGTWGTVSSAATGSNIASGTSIGADTSVCVVSYLNVTGDLSVSGNLMVTG